jgi:alkanesulfonate monooxygenase SsuD/methylene tetrahydromethanopterin reductase-like flavin-dependent oxidoreductase (luciferase family)
VLNNLHYEPGVLAKESSILAIASGGRFELGIGAGDWPDSFAAWGRPYPDGDTRVQQLGETVAALRRIWAGEAVTFEGEHVRLTGATCTPAPALAPRVVVGVGSSRRTLRHAVEYADELNIYADTAILAAAREEIGRTGRDVEVSLFLGWEMDKWPTDPAGELGQWADQGVERFLINVGGGPDMPSRIRQLAPLQNAA